MPLSIQAKLLRARRALRAARGRDQAAADRRALRVGHEPRPGRGAGRPLQETICTTALPASNFSIPPLRRRPLEIEPLARLFLYRFCLIALGLPMPELTGALQAMHVYSWPGNVRELKNIMERAPFLCEKWQDHSGADPAAAAQ